METTSDNRLIEESPAADMQPRAAPERFVCGLLQVAGAVVGRPWLAGEQAGDPPIVGVPRLMAVGALVRQVRGRAGQAGWAEMIAWPGS